MAPNDRMTKEEPQATRRSHFFFTARNCIREYRFLRDFGTLFGVCRWNRETSEAASLFFFFQSKIITNTRRSQLENRRCKIYFNLITDQYPQRYYFPLHDTSKRSFSSRRVYVEEYVKRIRFRGPEVG